MRLVLTGGGTAGHVYPALAVAESLRGPLASETEPPDVLYVGSRTGPEQNLAGRSSLRFHGLDVAGGLRGMGASALGNGLSLARGFVQAMGLMREWRPAAVLATGGYVCAPVVLAGWFSRVPSLVYLPDTEPGWAIRFLAPLASRIAITVSESVRFFAPDKCVLTGYPTRKDISPERRAEGRAHFGVEGNDKLVLVAGGSRGARRINEAVAATLPELLETARVLHSCGEAHYEELNRRAEELPAALRARYRLYPYLHDMPLALAAADLAVSRSGASVLGEYPAVGLPSILVPYAGGHRDQELNARYLVEHGCAVLAPDESFDGPALLAAVGELLKDEARLQAMREAAASLARPGAAELLAVELLRLARGR